MLVAFRTDGSTVYSYWEATRTPYEIITALPESEKAFVHRWDWVFLEVL